MSVSQTDFIQALLDPNVTTPPGLQDPQGRPAGRRFSVYRNNVAVSLTEALETAFPVIRKLVGEEFFRAAAGVYLRQHPPSSPLMMYYGDDFPAFLETFPPARSLAYLADVARLELALRRAYHAADVPPMAAASLGAHDQQALATATIGIAPSLQILLSDWPIHAIWKANTESDAPKPMMRPESVLVTRPGYDPVVTLITRPEAGFIKGLSEGKTILQAIAAASEMPDLARVLGLLMSGNAITEIKIGTAK